MKHCPNCNFKTDLDADVFCAICGARLKTVSENPLCRSCGAELKPKAIFCTKCGTAVNFFGPSLSAASERCTDTWISVTSGKLFPANGLTTVPTVKSGTPPQVKPGTPPPVKPGTPPPVKPGTPPQVKPAASPAPAGTGTKPLPVQSGGFDDTDCVMSPEATGVIPPAAGGQREFKDYRMPAIMSEGFISREKIRELSRQAMEVIPERVAHYAPLVGVTYKKITIGNWKTIWGTCTYRRGYLDFNCILMLMPTEALDSVVVHELCHLIQPDHSDKFYAEVNRVFPDYGKWDAWLEDHSSVLDRMEDGYYYRSSKSF